MISIYPQLAWDSSPFDPNMEKAEKRLIYYRGPMIYTDWTKNGRRTFVDASILQWGQNKTHNTIYLSVNSPPQLCITNADTHLLLFTFAPNDCTKYASTKVRLRSCI